MGEKPYEILMVKDGCAKPYDMAWFFRRNARVILGVTTIMLLTTLSMSFASSAYPDNKGLQLALNAWVLVGGGAMFLLFVPLAVMNLIYVTYPEFRLMWDALHYTGNVIFTMTRVSIYEANAYKDRIVVLEPVDNEMLYNEYRERLNMWLAEHPEFKGSERLENIESELAKAYTDYKRYLIADFIYIVDRVIAGETDLIL